MYMCKGARGVAVADASRDRLTDAQMCKATATHARVKSRRISQREATHNPLLHPLICHECLAPTPTIPGLPHRRHPT